MLTSNNSNMWFQVKGKTEISTNYPSTNYPFWWFGLLRGPTAALQEGGLAGEGPQPTLVGLDGARGRPEILYVCFITYLYKQHLKICFKLCYVCVCVACFSCSRIMCLVVCVWYFRSFVGLDGARGRSEIDTNAYEHIATPQHMQYIRTHEIHIHYEYIASARMTPALREARLSIC